MIRLYVKKRGKVTPLTGPVWPRGWVEAQLYFSMTAALEGGEWSTPRAGHTLPPGKTRCPFYRRLGGLQGRSGGAENLVPTGIRSRTVQPVVRRISLYVKKNINTKRKVLQVTKKFKIILKDKKIIFGFSQNTTIHFCFYFHDIFRSVDNHQAVFTKLRARCKQCK